MPERVGAASLDLGLLLEANAFALWVRSQRGPLDLTAIAPMLDSLRERMKAVSTSSTLVALMLIDVLQVSGHLEHARHLSDEIIDFARARSERVYLPELLRHRRMSAVSAAALVSERSAAVVSVDPLPTVGSSPPLSG